MDLFVRVTFNESWERTRARQAGVRQIGTLRPFPTAERIREAQPDLLLEPVRGLRRYLRVAS